MEVVLTDIPRCLRSFSFSPKTILSERNTVDYLIRTKEYIFGSRCCEDAVKLSIDVFNLVFLNDKPFVECCEMYLTKIRDRDKEIIKTALLLKKMHNRENVKICKIYCKGDMAYVLDPENAYLDVLNDVPDPEGRKKLEERRKKREEKKTYLTKRGQTFLESIRLAAMKYGMKKTIEYKELIDKYNYRRFSTNMKLNSRPISVDEFNSVFGAIRDKCIADLSDAKIRINLSALYVIAFGGMTLNDLYSKECVFDVNGMEKDQKISSLCGNLYDIVYNGNGVEIANTLLRIISGFASVELPKVNMKDLGSVMDNYSVYYGAATLASLCESIFRSESFNGELKQYMKKHIMGNYWSFMDRLMLMKQYAIVVAFCYKLANFDVESYQYDPEYQSEILYSFERASKFAKELRNIG